MLYISFSMTGSDAPVRFDRGNAANNGKYAIQRSFLKSNQSESITFHTYNTLISSIYFDKIKMSILFRTCPFIVCF